MGVLALYLGLAENRGGVLGGLAMLPLAVVATLGLAVVYRPLIEALRAPGSGARISVELARWSPLWLGVLAPLALCWVGVAQMLSVIAGTWILLAARLAALWRRSALQFQGDQQSAARSSAEWDLRWDFFAATWGCALILLAAALTAHDPSQQVERTGYLVALFSLIPLYGNVMNAEERDHLLTHRHKQAARVSFALLVPPIALANRISDLGPQLVAFTCVAGFIAVREVSRRHARDLRDGAGRRP